MLTKATEADQTVSTSQPMAAAVNHYYWLDLFRFVSAFLVVVCHTRGGNWQDWARINPGSHTLLNKFFFMSTRAGVEWVVVFFVLSGYLVGGKVIERTTKGTFNLTSFAIDRITRIWVPLVPTLILSAVIGRALGWPMTWEDFLGNFAGLQGVFCGYFVHNVPLWSLSFEIWFYVLAGIMGAVLTTKRAPLWAWALLAGILAMYTKLNIAFFGCWILGAVAYPTSKEARYISITPGILLMATGLLISQLLAVSDSFKTAPWLPTRDVAAIIEALGVALIVRSVAHREPTHPIAWGFEKFGRMMAPFSYTLYLTHYVVLATLANYLPNYAPSINANSFGIFILKLATCLLVAWLMYLAFERNTPAVRSWCAEVCGVKPNTVNLQ